MKKTFLILFLLLLFIFPIKAYAQPYISGTSIKGGTEQTVGNSVLVTFTINMAGFDLGDKDCLGVVAVGYELIFDSNVFVVTGLSSPNLDSDIYKEEEGHYYIVGYLNENSLTGTCSNGVRYCGDTYTTTLQFFIKDTKQTSSSIEMGEVEMSLLRGSSDNIDEAISVDYHSGKTHTVNIRPTSTPITQTPADIAGNGKPSIDTGKIPTSEPNVNSSIKSSNMFLSNLEVGNYKIAFNRLKNDYTITINKDVNSLNIKATLEDSKASYKIIGAEDLSKNNYKVLIEVTAENGEKNTYTITAKIKNEEPNKSVSSPSKSKDSKKEKINYKKYLTIGGIIGGVILLIIIIIRIIIHTKDRKLERALDEL